MLLKRFYDERLAQASYLLGCTQTGDAIVIDPNRDVAQYVAAADAERLRITHVTETHIHADFVSGSRELAARTGARLLLSDEGGVDWRYAFAASDGATLLRHEDRIVVGNSVRLDVLHTPGHTPEHLTFLVTDAAAAAQPMGAFTGDFIFVGDVGRPDLLERAANMAGTMEGAARQLFRSLRVFAELPDFLQLWPGHGPGSACGKSLGAVPQSTLGYERLSNWALRETDEEAFVDAVLAGQPEPPAYFAEMKRVNRAGPRILRGIPRPPELSAGALGPLLDSDALVVDVRSAGEFAEGHRPATINIPLNRSFVTWAGWLLPYERDLYLIGHEPAAIESAARALSLIGMDRVVGGFRWDAVARGASLERTPQVALPDVRKGSDNDGYQVLDVRSRAEWDAGHIPGAMHIPLGELPRRMSELPRDRPIAVHCQSGSRSAIATSLLLAAGVRNVADYTAGFAEWEGEGGKTLVG
jgi:hydroxyacylglutathione hydrolase